MPIFTYGALFASLPFLVACRPYQLDVANPQRLGESEKRLDRRVPLASLQSAYILLTEVGTFGHGLLRQP